MLFFFWNIEFGGLISFLDKNATHNRVLALMIVLNQNTKIHVGTSGEGLYCAREGFQRSPFLTTDIKCWTALSYTSSDQVSVVKDANGRKKDEVTNLVVVLMVDRCW